MKFNYTAYDRSGAIVNDAIDAPSLNDAGEMLRARGLFATTLSPDGPAGARKAAGDREASHPRLRWSPVGKTRRLKDVAIMFRQLSVLVATGTPITEALQSLERQAASGKWKDTIADMRGRIEQGASLSSVLEHHPLYFDGVSRSLIAAGESSGMLDDMLKRLSALTRQQVRVRSSISGAMVYPILLIFVAIGVLNTMLFFVLPRFEELFQSLGAPLPASTQFLVDLSSFLRSYWWAVLAGLVPLGVGVVAMVNSARGRELWAQTIVKVPQVGNVVKSFAQARICRVLGVLVEGKVPLLDALVLAEEGTGNVLYGRLVNSARQAVERGETMSGALEASPLMSRSIVEAIRSGERSGQLGPVLLSVADFLDEDNEVVLRSLSSLIEPLMLIVLGVLVGFVAMSMFLPLFDVATAAQTGGK